MYIPTAAARSFLKSRLWRRVPARNCRTFTSPSPAWKTFSCTTPEGACAIELEDFLCDAGPRRSCSAAQCDATLYADLPAALAVCVHFRQGDGGQRIYPWRVQ